ncbi:MAG TPA: lytic transglycosylase domain-containing protein [bacterium]|nr:lytic transglycosylase domain-containing protein [bacterium]
MEKKYEQIIENLNNSSEPLKSRDKYLLALSYRALKQNDEAFKILSDLNKTVVILKPLILYHLGNIKTENKEYTAANNFYKQILEHHRHYPALVQDILFKMVENCKNANQLAAAEQYLNILLKDYVNDYSYFKDVFLNHPVKTDIILEIARIEILRKQYKKAFDNLWNLINNYEKSDATRSAINILTRNPKNFESFLTPPVKFKIAQLNINRGRFSEGLAILEELKKSGYTVDAEFEYLIGWCYYKLNRPYNDVIPIFSKFLNEYKNSEFTERALFHLGIIYQKQKQYDKEKEIMEIIINNKQNDYYAFAAFKEIVEYYDDLKSVADINNTISRMIEFFNVPNKTRYLIDSLWYAFFYAYRMQNFQNADEILTALSNLKMNNDEKAKLNFWIYKTKQRLNNNRIENEKYLNSIVETNNYDSYYYWRALDLLAGKKNSTLTPLKKIYTFEQIIVDIEQYSKNHPLYSILSEIKDYNGLYLVSHKVDNLSLNQKKIPILLMIIFEKFSDAIATSKSVNSDKEFYWSVLYPYAYYEYVITNCANFGIDKALAFGIMREESRYTIKAVSSAGAIGLMQVMYPTGLDINKILQIPDFTRDRLFEPAINVMFGTFELKRLLDLWTSMNYDFTTALIFTIAGYNAGENAVKRWIPRFYNHLRDIDLFAELIPYKETRGYVDRVYKSYSIYKHLYK